VEDLDRIKFEIEIGKVIDKVANENLKDFSNNYRIFDTLAAYAAGDATKKFSSLRILVSLLGRQLAFLTLQMAAPKSNQAWRISIEKRRDSERPDHGHALRKLKLEDQVEQIGIAYHSLRKEGLLKAEAIKRIQLDLKLNLSESSIRQKLQIFSRLVKHRGYVDVLDPVVMRLTGGARQPKLLVSEIVKRGRPKRAK